MLGSKITQDLAAAALQGALVYVDFALSCLRALAPAVPSIWNALPSILMWHLLICILVSTPQTTEEPSLILPAEVIVLSSELREYLACSAVYFWVLFS